MRLPGFFGGTDTLRSYRADVERTENAVPEIIESGHGENRGWLGRRPGLNIYAQGSGAEGETIYAEPVTGRVFVVAGTALLEVDAAHTITSRGTVAASTAAVPPCIIGNGVGGQLLITSGGVVYNYELSTDTLTTISTADVLADVVQCLFVDGYFLVLNADGALQWSVLDDFVNKVPVTWDPLDVAQRSTMSDPWVGMTLLHREIRLYGRESAEAWTDVGDALQPFQLVQGSVNEVGTAAISSLAIIGNSVMFVGRNVQGQGIVWRAGGYIPERVSNHSVESALASSAQLDLARAMVVQQQGHTFYILRVPDLQQSWVYDLATQLWTNWAELVDDSTDPWRWMPWRGVATTFGFGRQLVVGPFDGYTVGTLDDTGSASSELLAVSSNAANLLLYDWRDTLRTTVTLTGTEGAGATAARTPSSTQAFASIRGGAKLDIYAGTSTTVPSASGTVGSVNTGAQWVRTYQGIGSVTAQYLLTGGGGGSGALSNGGLTGGGGGGQVVEGSTTLTVGTHPVIVGLGGAVGVAGSDTTWLGFTAKGGGVGGAEQTAGGNGGNGGGAGNAEYVGSGGDLGAGDWQSFPGGSGVVGGFSGGRDDINAAGGGAGAGGAGGQATQNTGGDGGAALASSISGASVNYGGGGAGQGLGTDGTPATSAYGQGGTDGAGTAGVVRVRYLTGAITATGGTITTDGSYTVHTFTASGSLVVSSAPALGSTWAVAKVSETIAAGSLAMLSSDADEQRFYNPSTGALIDSRAVSDATNLTPVSITSAGLTLSGSTLWNLNGGVIAAPITSPYTGVVFAPVALGALYGGKSALNAGNYESTVAVITSAGTEDSPVLLPDAIDDSGGHLDYIISTGTVTTDGASVYHVGRDRNGNVKVTAGDVGVADGDASGIWRIRTVDILSGSAGTDLYNSGATASTEAPVQVFTQPDNTIISLWRNSSGGRIRQHNTSGTVLQNYVIPIYTGVEAVLSGWPGATADTVWLKFANGLTQYVGELDLSTGTFTSLYTTVALDASDRGYLTTVDM